MHVYFLNGNKNATLISNKDEEEKRQEKRERNQKNKKSQNPKSSPKP
jgi:hypothetical protein